MKKSILLLSIAFLFSCDKKTEVEPDKNYSGTPIELPYKLVWEITDNLPKSTIVGSYSVYKNTPSNVICYQPFNGMEITGGHIIQETQFADQNAWTYFIGNFHTETNGQIDYNDVVKISIYFYGELKYTFTGNQIYSNPILINAKTHQ